MKKEYIKPEMLVEEILLEGILASSGNGIPGGDNPTDDGDILTNDRRGSWGDLWD